jgi:hypothetical protein
MEVKKDITYLGKDFGQFRKNLIDFTKQYFPNDYTDFNESSPGMLFMEMASYVGDVLSYYTDTNLKESLLEQASERKNIYDLAKALGYSAKNVIPSYTTLDIFQLVPATGTGANNVPDYTFALSLKAGLRAKQNNGSAEFRTTKDVDFSFSSSISPTEVTVYESDSSTNEPTYYLLKKQVPAVSGVIRTTNFSFNEPKQYDKVVLTDSNVSEIVSIKESDGDVWTEVPYLAQDTIFEAIPNLIENDPDFYQHRDSSPYLLKLKRTAKRFVKRLRSDNTYEIQFGAGISDNNDEEIIPNPKNVGNGLQGFSKDVDIDIDPSNFLYTRTYGQAPSNTTLTVTYTVGGGIADNVPAGTITDIDFVDYYDDPNSTASAGMINFVKSSLAVNNPNPATGGKSSDTAQDIKNNAMSNFATQNRLVTKNDYIIRTYSMPSKFGSVAKAYVVPDDQLSQSEFTSERVPNPLALNLYVLGFNGSKQLTNLNSAIKHNLQNYLSYYRMLTDAVNISDALIVNIDVEFEIIIRNNYNSNEVLLECVDTLKSYFNVDKWQINQPIVKTEVMNVIGNVNGVQNVVGVKFANLFDTDLGYSGNVYDLSAATKQGVIYPPLDPAIFEVKYPNQNIKGKVVNF